MTDNVQVLQSRISALEEKHRVDSWQNLFTGAGVRNRDKKLSSTFAATEALSEKELNALYRGNGFAKKIIDLPAKEMTREWFTVDGDTDNLIVQYFETIGIRKKITKLLKWSRLFGGGIGIMGLDDGGELDTKLDENGIRSLQFLHVFDRFRVNFTDTDLYSDPKNEKFGLPEYFIVSPRAGMPFKVHESRVLSLHGLDTPLTETRNSGWGDSALLSMYTQLRNLGVTYSATADIVESFEELVISIDNLQQLVAAGKESVVKKRLELLDLSRSTLNTTLLDAKEKFEKKSSTVTGLDKLIEQQALALSAVSGIPATLLLGKSPAGLSATGDSDIRQWYDNIAASQEDDLKPILERLVRVTMLTKDGPTKGVELEDWSIKFTPLWQPTEKETAETRKIIAETDDIYITNQVLDPQEIRESRFGGESFSANISIDASLTKTTKGV